MQQRTALAETDDDYCAVVAQLNDRWRVIACSAGIQWILQHAVRPETYPTSRWRGRSFCRTKEALTRLCRPQKAGPNVGPIDPAAQTILDALPDRFPERLNKDEPVPEAA
jgi:hypothetical protein